MIDLGAEAVTRRLREACAHLARLPAVRDPGAPTPAEATERLREAAALWVMCAKLGMRSP